MDLLINSSLIPIVKDWKSLCSFENNQVSSSSLPSSSESSLPFPSSPSSSIECIDLITFLNKSDLESLLTLYNDSLVTDPSFAFASSVSSSISGSSFTLSSASSAASASRKFVPDLVVQIIWSIVFGLMILVAMMGNLTVIWIVTGHRKMRTVTNVFLLNLTIADLIMATFNGVFNFVYMLRSHWPFGQTYCKINNFIANVTVASSVFTITATSIDRYIAVVHPLKPRMTKHQVMLIIIMVWSLAALLSLPNLLYSELFTIPFNDGGYRVVCILVWPDGYHSQSTFDYLYNLTFLAITYVIPMISLIITYSLMSRVLWGSKGIGEETDIQRESIRSKQKVARMLIALVVLFAICWLPYHAYFLYSYHYPHINQSVVTQHIYLFSYWLAMSNSMYNPLVYYWMNKRFRSYFASIFCFFSRNRLKKQLSYNVKTDLSSNGFQHGTTHYRRTPVQSSNQIELHQHNNLDDPDYPTCNNNSSYPETKLNLNPSKQSNGYLLQQSSDSKSPLILNNVFKGVLINGNTINDDSDNSNSTFNGHNNGHNNGHANGNSLINSQSIVHNNNNHNNQSDFKSNHGANCECNRLSSNS